MKVHFTAYWEEGGYTRLDHVENETDLPGSVETISKIVAVFTGECPLNSTTGERCSDALAMGECCQECCQEHSIVVWQN